MTVSVTSDEYYLSPRWFWRDRPEGDVQTYNLIRATIYNAALGQPWVGVSAAQAATERCCQIGWYQDMGWACSPFFDVWVASSQFRCVRFVKGLSTFPPKGGTPFFGAVVAVCVRGSSTDQVLMIEASAGEQFPETRPPAPPK